MDPRRRGARIGPGKGGGGGGQGGARGKRGLLGACHSASHTAVKLPGVAPAATAHPQPLNTEFVQAHSGMGRMRSPPSAPCTHVRGDKRHHEGPLLRRVPQAEGGHHTCCAAVPRVGHAAGQRRESGRGGGGGVGGRGREGAVHALQGDGSEGGGGGGGGCRVSGRRLGRRQGRGATC